MREMGRSTRLRAPVRACLSGAAVVLTVTGTAVPAHAIVIASGAYVCQIGDFTISAPAPLSLTLPATLQSDLTVGGSGTCSGLAGETTFTLTGTVTSIGPPTCAAIVGIGNGVLTFGGLPPQYVEPFALAEPGVAGAAVLTTTSPAPGNPIAAFTLEISSASLAACLTGGATSVDFSGVAVLTFT